MNNLPPNFDKDMSDLLHKYKEADEKFSHIFMQQIEIPKEIQDAPKVVVIGTGVSATRVAILALAHAMQSTCISSKQLAEARELMPKYSYPIPETIKLSRIEVPEFNYTPTPEYNSSPKNYGQRKTKKYRI